MVPTGVFLAGWVLILVWRFLSEAALATSANVVAYALLAVIAMAAIGCCAAKWHPALKRMVALLACAILAGADAGMSGLEGEAAQKAFFAALLGIALIVLASRHAPSRLRQKWMGEGGS